MKVPELAASVAASLSTLAAVMAVIQKGLRLMKTLTPVFRLLFVAIAAVELALGSKTGAEKKAAVIAKFGKDLPPIAAELGAPAGVVDFLVNPAVLGFVIDLLVEVLNKTGALQKLEELRAWLGLDDQVVDAIVPAAQEGPAQDPTTPPAVAS